MKTTCTTTIDTETKREALPIIQNELKTSMSQILERELIKIIAAHKQKIIKENNSREIGA